MTESDQLTQMLREQIAAAVDSAVQKHVIDFVQQMALDPKWVNKIETLVTQNVTQRFNQHISGFDINAMMAGFIDDALERWKSLLLHDFRTRGIRDQAQDLQLTITDEVSVFNNAVSAPALVVEDEVEVQGTLSVDNLVVRGTVNGDAEAWVVLADDVAQRTMNLMTNQWRETLVQQVLDLAQHRGIDFDSVTIDGFPLFAGDRLNPNITKTNIQRVGVLEELMVSGRFDAQDTLSVRQGRIGINTQEPESAMNIWDGEVSINLGKHDKDTAFIGTGRKQTLGIGVNRKPVIRIDESGLTSLPRLRIDRWIIGHSTTVPGWEGTRGDFILNSDPKPNAPFAWVCLGGTRWQSLKAQE